MEDTVPDSRSVHIGVSHFGILGLDTEPHNLERGATVLQQAR